KGRAAESCRERDQVVAQLQSVRGGHADVEHDFAVLDVLPGNGDPLGARVHHDVRSLAAIADPLVQGAQQIRPPRLQWRMPRSASVRQDLKVERANIAFMYLVMGCA